MTQEDGGFPSSSSSNSKSSFLAPALRPKTRKSTASLQDEASNGRFSLAHELAHALMPEPSAGSKLLAEEFGIEYDEGAEGIDEPPSPARNQPLAEDIQFGQPQPEEDTNEIDPDFGGDSIPESPTKPRTKKKRDAMQTLERDLDNTNRFLSHLRSVDVSASSSAQSPTPSSPTIEQLASSIIQKLNSSAQDRESQVRELLSYEREFRKISGDVLGALEELPIEMDPSKDEEATVDTIDEERSQDQVHRRGESAEWDQDPMYAQEESAEDTADDGHSDSDESGIQTPTKPGTPPPPLPSSATFSPSLMLPQLAYIRTTTTSLVSSLTSLSEQAQINSVFTTEAGTSQPLLARGCLTYLYQVAKLEPYEANWVSGKRNTTKWRRVRFASLSGSGKDPNQREISW